MGGGYYWLIYAAVAQLLASGGLYRFSIVERNLHGVVLPFIARCIQFPLFTESQALSLNADVSRTDSSNASIENDQLLPYHQMWQDYSEGVCYLRVQARRSIELRLS
jgi:hypothetical protein